MPFGQQVSEAVEHKLPQSLCEEINPQLINAYTRNKSPQYSARNGGQFMSGFLSKSFD